MDSVLKRYWLMIKRNAMNNDTAAIYKRYILPFLWLLWCTRPYSKQHQSWTWELNKIQFQTITIIEDILMHNISVTEMNKALAHVTNRISNFYTYTVYQY